MASVVEGRVKDVGYGRRLARRQTLYVSSLDDETYQPPLILSIAL